MKRYSYFVRSNAVGAALILGLLMCCQAALAGGPQAQNDNTVTPETPTKVKETPTKVKPETPTKPKKPYQPPAPETLKIFQGMNPLSLSGPQTVGIEPGGETSQGMWAIQTIQKITKGLTPTHSELARFATKDDITAGEDLAADDTINSPLPATRVKSSSVVLELPITWYEWSVQDLAWARLGVTQTARYVSGRVVMPMEPLVSIAPGWRSALRRQITLS